MNKKNNYLPALNGLRFFAAFFVLLNHAIPQIMPTNNPSKIYSLFSDLAGIGMPLFFILSGFVIYYNYSNIISKKPVKGYKLFLIARIARLYPLFFTIILFDFVYTNYNHLFDSNAYLSIPFFILGLQSWFYYIFGNNPIIYSFGYSTPLTWSISTEWFFYLLFPVIVFIIKKFNNINIKIFILLMLYLICLLLIPYIGSFNNEINNYAVQRFGPIADSNSGFQNSFIRWLFYFSPYFRIIEFAAGCLTASIYLSLSNKKQSYYENFYCLILLIISIISCFVLYFTQNFYLKQCNGIILPISVIIFCCSRYKNFIINFLSTKFMVFLGELSYSIYLIHIYIIGLFKFAIPFKGYYGKFHGHFLLITVIIFTIFISFFSWWIIEIPGKRLVNYIFYSVINKHKIK